MLAKDIMETKVITLKKDTPVRDIAKLVVEQNISGFPVVDGENRVLGVVSEYDLMRKEIKPNEPNLWSICIWGLNDDKKMEKFLDATRKHMANTAEQIMTAPAVTVDEQEDMEKVGQRMFDKNVKRVFVTKDGKLVGVISRSAFVKHLLAKEMEAGQA